MQAYLYLTVNIFVIPQVRLSSFYALSMHIQVSEKSGKKKENNLPIIFYLSSLRQEKLKLSVVWCP